MGLDESLKQKITEAMAQSAPDPNCGGHAPVSVQGGEGSQQVAIGHANGPVAINMGTHTAAQGLPLGAPGTRPCPACKRSGVVPETEHCWVCGCNPMKVTADRLALARKRAGERFGYRILAAGGGAVLLSILLMATFDLQGDWRLYVGVLFLGGCGVSLFAVKTLEHLAKA